MELLEIDNDDFDNKEVSNEISSYNNRKLGSNTGSINAKKRWDSSKHEIGSIKLLKNIFPKGEEEKLQAKKVSHYHIWASWSTQRTLNAT